MAIVPQYKPQVQAQSGRLPEVYPGSVSARSFGADIGQGLQNFGQGIINASEDATKIVNQLNKENMQRVAKDRDNIATQRISDLWNGNKDTPGYRSLRGQAALDALPKFQEDLAKIREDSIADIGNQQVTDMVGGAVNERITAAMGQAGSHAYEQREVANTESSKLRTNLAISDAASAPMDPIILGRSVDIAATEAGQTADRMGLGPEEAQQLVKEARSNVLSAAIQSAAETNTKNGEKLFAQYGAELEGVTHGKVIAFLKAKHRQDIVDIEHAETLHDKQLTESQKANYSQATYAASQGTMTIPALDKMLAGNLVNPEQYHQIRSFMANADKIMTNKSTFLNMQANAYLGNTTMAEVIARNDLSFQDQKTLLSIINTSEERGGLLARKDVKNATQNIHDLVVGVTGPMAIVTGDGAERLVNAQQEFRDIITQDPLHPPSPDEVQKIQESVVKRWKGDKIVPITFVNLPNPEFFTGSRTSNKKQMAEQLLSAGKATKEALAKGQMTQEQYTYNMQLLDQYRQVNDALPDEQRTQGK